MFLLLFLTCVISSATYHPHSATLSYTLHTFDTRSWIPVTSVDHSSGSFLAPWIAFASVNTFGDITHVVENTNNITLSLGGPGRLVYANSSMMPRVESPPGFENTLHVSWMQYKTHLNLRVSSCVYGTLTSDFVCESCGKNYYYDDNMCKPCKTGMRCETSNVMLKDIQVNKGFYRTSPSSHKTYRCEHHKQACPGDGKTARFKDAYCAPRYTGILCGTCKSSTFRFVTGKCIRCRIYHKVLASFLIFICCILLVSIVTVFVSEYDTNIESYLLRFYNSIVDTIKIDLIDIIHEESPKSTQPRSKYSSRYIVTTFKVLVTFFQTIASFQGDYYHSKFNALQQFAFIFGLKVSYFIPFECLIRPYLSTISVVGMNMIIFASLALIIPFILIIVYTMTPRYRSLIRYVTAVIVLLGYIYVPTWVRTIINSITCRSFDFGSTHKSFVASNLSVSCESKYWKYIILPCAVFNITIYAAVLPLLIASYIHSYADVLNPETKFLCDEARRASIISGMDMSNFKNSEDIFQRMLDEFRLSLFQHDKNTSNGIYMLRFMWQDYKPKFYLWEFVDIARRIILHVILISFRRNIFKLVLAIGITTTSFIFFTHFDPLLEKDDSILNFHTQVGTIMALFVAMFSELGTLDKITSSSLLILIGIYPFIVLLYLNYIWKSHISNITAANFEESLSSTTRDELIKIKASKTLEALTTGKHSRLNVSHTQGTAQSNSTSTDIEDNIHEFSSENDLKCFKVDLRNSHIYACRERFMRTESNI